MYEAYVKVLGANAKQVYEDMTGLGVMSAKVEPRSLAADSLPVAQVVEYNGKEEELSGYFVLGCHNQATALSLAGDLAAKMGLPASTSLDGTAIDLLSEFMNTVVGRTISVWEHMGLPVEFGALSPLQQADIASQDGYQMESYAMMLNMAVNCLEFQVVFTQTDARATGAREERRVMVVEDSATQRRFVEMTLVADGYTVAQAEDGEQAQEVFKSFVPHVVLMDLIMPKMGGLDAIMGLMEMDPDAKIVVMTSSKRRDEMVTAKMLGVKNFLLKPLETATLKAVMARLFSSGEEA